MHMMSYCSRSTIDPAQAEAEIRSIAELSAANNSLLDVTGVLIYEGENFVQVLEGEAGTLQQLLNKIKEDPRHEEFTILANQHIEIRQYDDWAMETFFVSDPDIVSVETLRGLSSIYQQNFEMRTRTYVEFLRHLVDEIDAFKIRNSSA